jgi:membrane protease YdiL (CAAX protease family)
MAKCSNNKYYKLLYGSIAVIALFIVQVFAGKSGGAVADLLSYNKIDFYNTYAWVSVHHIIQMLIVLSIIVVLSKLLKVDFGFKLGDSKKGMRYLIFFTAAFAAVTLLSHILMCIYHQLPRYDFPLNKSNVIGTLGFQLFLSGPSEEIVFRALPVTMLTYVFGKSINIKWNITLEIMIASFFFSIAHMKWSLFPFTMEVNYFRLFYAFVLGTIQGIAYQESHSIVYPMLMHSLSNFLMVGTGYQFALL